MWAMRTHIQVRALAAALLTLSAVAVGACGGDSPGADAATREQKARDAQLAFAKCMRDHGIDMPDPSPNQGGINLRVPRGTSPAKVDAADKACQKHLEAVRGPDLSPEQEKKFQEAALAQARCMREHGVDMPDPTFDGNGRATIRIRGGSGHKGSGPDDDPDFKKAEEACRRLAPKPPGGAGTEKSLEGSP
jgi:hypothetical protein